MANLQERLDGFKKSFESGAPPYNAPREAIEKMHRATAELEASGIENRALKVGDRAPNFTLFNQDHAHRGNAVCGYQSQAFDAAMDAGIDSVKPPTDSLDH
ncbi:MAG: hypothetical protein WA383_02935 [Terriglobales bacterium]